jgi:trigger factor
MQITIEDLSPVEKKVEFELPWADVAPKLDKAYDSLRRGVRLPGFRPGKVPRALLERMYRRQVEDEVARELVERSLGQAIQENQIQPVAPPAVAEIEIKTGAPFKFSARVEVRSQVTPKDYAGIELSRRPPEVKDEQVTEALEGYRRRLTQFKPVDAGARKETGEADLVRAEIHGKVGEHKIKKRELLVDLEDDVHGPLPGLASRLRGKPIGGETPIEVDYTLPEEGVPAEMAGRHVHLNVSIKEVREKQVPALDDELAKDTGEADTLEGLKTKVRERLADTDKTRIKREMERALIKELVKRNEFPIAPALVERYAQAIVNRAKSQLMMMGVDVESVDDTKMRTEVKAEAEEEARGAILLQAIGEREGITASDADVQKRIAELAQGRNETPKQLRAELEKDGRIRAIETQIREQKTLDLLISQAKITDGEPASSLIVTPEQARQEAAAGKSKAKKPKGSTP